MKAIFVMMLIMTLMGISSATRVPRRSLENKRPYGILENRQLCEEEEKHEEHKKEEECRKEEEERKEAEKCKREEEERKRKEEEKRKREEEEKCKREEEEKRKREEEERKRKREEEENSESRKCKKHGHKKGGKKHKKHGQKKCDKKHKKRGHKKGGKKHKKRGQKKCDKKHKKHGHKKGGKKDKKRGQKKCDKKQKKHRRQDHKKKVVPPHGDCRPDVHHPEHGHPVHRPVPRSEVISVASSEKSQTSGSSLAVGNGKTCISSSIGEQGSVTNIEASKGGLSLSNFGQQKESKASKDVERRDAKGNVEVVSVASENAYNVAGQNVNTFGGEGASSSVINKNGVNANVHGAEGAANANAFNKQSENAASGQAYLKSVGARRRMNVAPRKHHIGHVEGQDN